MEPLEALMARSKALVDEAERSVAAGTSLGGAWLGRACEHLATAADSWPAVFGAAPATRTYWRLAGSEAFEAWLNWWPPQGGLALHDHGGAAGAFAVVGGELHETFVAREARPVAVLVRRAVAAGASVTFGADHVHEVANHHAEGATSVHVYGAPTTTMTFYDHRMPRGLVPRSRLRGTGPRLAPV